MTLTDADLVYVAAVVDLLGHVTVRSMEGTDLPYIAISTRHVELLSDLGEMTGTKVLTTRRAYNQHRCREHCDEAHQHVESVSGRWQLTGAKATVLLAAIKPFIRFQKTDIEEALKVGLGAPKKPATPNKMKALGWPIPEEWQ